MRFDPWLDSFYVLSALWGGLTGPQVCSSVPPLEAARGPESRPSAAVTAFVGVNVIPMDTERVLPNQTVLVEGERITALGPVATVKVPAGAVRIDGRGKYLIPGFTDMHDHDITKWVEQYDEKAPYLFRQLSGGFTAVRNLNHASPEMAQLVRHSKLAEEKLLPYLYLAGELERFLKPGVSPDSALAAYKAAGYEFLYGWIAADELRAAARRLRFPWAIHSHSLSFEQTLALAPSGSAEHLYMFLDSLEVFNRNSRDRLASRPLRSDDDVSLAEIEPLARAAKRSGVWLSPTLECLLGLKSFPGRNPLYRKIIKALNDTGVPLFLGEAHAPNDLEELVRAGLTPYQALVAGTRNPAEYFGLLDKTGTVAVGKRADLVLLPGNPLQNIEHTQEPAGVMNQGRWFDRAELDQRLLATPRWFRWMANVSGLRDLLSEEQQAQLSPAVAALDALADSLAAARTSGAERSTAERLVRRQAEEIGAIRALVAASPARRSHRLDAQLRVWLREQTRQGHRVAIAGLSTAP